MFALTILIIASAVAHVSPQAAPAATVAAGPLTVAGDVATPLTLQASELKTMTRTHVEMKTEGKTVAYDGVLVAEILKRAGVPIGAELRGPALATTLLATASDGYQVAFSIGEL